MTRKRPHELTLEVLNEVGKTATPLEIDTHVNLRSKDGSLGEYSGKHVWFLRKMGFDIIATKDGRTVLSYTLQGEPENAAEVRAGRPAKAPKVKAPKAPKVVKEKTAKAPKAPKVKAPKAQKVVKTDTEAVAALEVVMPVVPVMETKAVANPMPEDRLAAFKAAKARLAQMNRDPEVPTVVAEPVSDWDYDAAVNARMLGIDVPVADIREEM
jgi:hypothetical protein